MVRRIVWLYGLSGAGKSTLSNRLEASLTRPTFVIDADDVRDTINADLNFSGEDRAENNRRLAQAALWIDRKGFQVIVSSMLPTDSLRDLVKSEVGPRLQLVYVKCSWTECVKRDPKGLYTKWKEGKLQNFDSGFDEPYRPEITVETTGRPVQECVDFLRRVLFT